MLLLLLLLLVLVLVVSLLLFLVIFDITCMYIFLTILDRSKTPRESFIIHICKTVYFIDLYYCSSAITGVC